MSKDTKKQYLLDDSARDAPTDDYLAYASGADGAGSTDLAAKRKKWLIGGVVITLALAVLTGIIVWGVHSGSKDDPPAPPSGTPIWQQYRLPPNVRPSSYNVSLRIDLDRLLITGVSTVAVSITDRNMSDIVLHSLGLTVTQVSVQAMDGPSPTNLTYELYGQAEDSYQYLVLHGNGWQFPITPLLYITTTFQRELPTNTSSGLYATYYTDPTSGQAVWVAATQFEPTHSRRAFPNFDELQMKAVFNVTMEVKQGLVALTNAPQVASYPVDSGFQRVVFSPTAVRQSSYLMAFAVADYVSVLAAGSGTGGVYPFRCWGRKDRISEAQFYCDRGFKVQQFFHTLLGQQFPLPKQDQIAIPNKGGAMENYGLVTYYEDGIYLTSDTTSAVYQGAVNVNAHELAHMLWGDLFTPLWWSDTWTKEGSATFWSYVGMQAIMGDVGDWQSDSQAVAGYMESALRADVQSDTVPLVYEANTPFEVAARFRGPTYNKGGSLLRMIRGILTEPSFYQGATQFLAQYRTSNGLSIDYFTILNQNKPSSLSSKNITDVFWQWGSQSGFPLITAAPSSNPVAGRRVWTLTQAPYAPVTSDSLSAPAPASARWPVWVQYAFVSASTGAIQTAETWLDASSNYQADISVPDDVRFVKLNYNRTGFYRVRYPLSVYPEFQTELASYPVSGWTHQDRISLLLDTYQLQVDGLLQSWPVALNATLFLQKERAYPVWSAGAYVLSDMWSRLRYHLLRDSSSMTNFTRYVHLLAANATSELLWRQVNFTEHLQGMMQQTLAPLACRAGSILCAAQASTMYQQWKTSKTLPPANFRPLAFGYGSSVADFDFLLTTHLAEPNPAYAAIYLDGAIQSADVPSLVRLLTGAQDTPERYLRPNGTWSGLLTRVVTLNDYGLTAGMQWLNETGRFARLAMQLDTDALRGQLNTTIATLVEPQQWQEDLEMVMGVMGQNIGVLNGGVQARYQAALTSAGMRIQWVRRNWPDIAQWLAALPVTR